MTENTSTTPVVFLSLPVTPGDENEVAQALAATVAGSRTTALPAGTTALFLSETDRAFLTALLAQTQETERASSLLARLA